MVSTPRVVAWYRLIVVEYPIPAATYRDRARPSISVQSIEGGVDRRRQTVPLARPAIGNMLESGLRDMRV